MVVGVVVMPRSNPELAAKMGKRMVIRRKELGLTQEQVAELAGIAHQQYNKAEKGKTCLGSDTLNRISAALNISADYLLTGIGEQQRYYETLKVLEQMSDRQLNLANQDLRCMLQFEDTKREYT